MEKPATPRAPGDGHLWMISLAASLLVNGGMVVLIGFASLNSEMFTRIPKPAAPEEETVVQVFPQIETSTKSAAQAPAPAPEPEPVPVKKRFARTSPEQTPASEPKNSAFIGERSTAATSDRAPDASAPPLPSQKGIEPAPGEIETTESRYQDGTLAGRPDKSPADTTPEDEPPAPREPDPGAEPAAARPPVAPPRDAGAMPPAREKLLEGPNPVDVQVPRETSPDKTPEPAKPGKPAVEETPPEPLQPEKPAESAKPREADLPKPKPKPSNEPEFKGFQRKTALVGSIQRTGHSALDVEDSVLGKYGAAISRAVELEFQRNCVRNRDYITPGFLTVRFFVEPSGKVRSVRLDGDMSTGEIQKGFTLNSIRDADIPPMPPALRKEYAKEPLELVFRFYF